MLDMILEVWDKKLKYECSHLSLDIRNHKEMVIIHSVCAEKNRVRTLWSGE